MTDEFQGNYGAPGAGFSPSYRKAGSNNNSRCGWGGAEAIGKAKADLASLIRFSQGYQGYQGYLDSQPCGAENFSS